MNLTLPSGAFWVHFQTMFFMCFWIYLELSFQWGSPLFMGHLKKWCHKKKFCAKVTFILMATFGKCIKKINFYPPPPLTKFIAPPPPPWKRSDSGLMRHIFNTNQWKTISRIQRKTYESCHMFRLPRSTEWLVWKSTKTVRKRSKMESFSHTHYKLPI